MAKTATYLVYTKLINIKMIESFCVLYEWIYYYLDLTPGFQFYNKVKSGAD